jgi:hypothetical protein
MVLPSDSDDAKVLPRGSNNAKQELDLSVPTSEDGCHGVVIF